MGNRRRRENKGGNWNHRNRRLAPRFIDQINDGVRTISLEEEEVTEKLQKLSISVRNRDSGGGQDTHRTRPTRATTHATRPNQTSMAEGHRPRSRKRENSPSRQEREWKKRVVHLKWNQDKPHTRGEIHNMGRREQKPHQKAMVVGHSLVNRLKQDILREYKGRRVDWPKALDVNREGINPYIHGIPGAKISTLRELEAEIWKVKPKCVIIDIGTNDCCSNTPARFLANKLVKELNHWLDTMHFLRSLTWCHIIPRTRTGNRRLDARAFKKKSIIFNRYMVDATKERRELHHWKHRGLTLATDDKLCDGIHLNEDSLWKYKKSVSRICKWAMKNVN